MLGRWQTIAQTADIADPHPNEVKDAAKDRSAAVAEVCFADAGRPDERRTKARHSSGGGLEAGRGTRGENSSQREYFTVPSNTHQIKLVLQKSCNSAIFSLFSLPSSRQFRPSIKYPSNKTCHAYAQKGTYCIILRAAASS